MTEGIKIVSIATIYSKSVGRIKNWSACVARAGWIDDGEGRGRGLVKTEVDGRRSRYCCGDGGDCEQKLQMRPLLVVLNFGARGFAGIWLGEKGWNRSSSRWS
jgi:hypothetical protein